MTQKWIDQIEELTFKFNGTFGSLSREQLNWKPNEDSWSIAQIIDHLAVVGQSYRETFAALKSGTYKAPFLAKIGFLVKFMGKTILDGSGPDRSKPIRTFSIWQPTQSVVDKEVFDRFHKTQLDLKEWIKASQPDLKKGSVISSPANRNIVYTLETALDIIVAHERRHLEQAKEVLGLLEAQDSEMAQ